MHFEAGALLGSEGPVTRPPPIAPALGRFGMGACPGQRRRMCFAQGRAMPNVSVVATALP